MLGQFVRMQSGVTCNGNFDYGENLVWTGNPTLGMGSGGPFLIELANPVASIGIGIQADFFGPFTAKVQLYDPSFNLLATYNFQGNSASTLAGDNLFVGLGDKTGVNIGSILISTVSPGAGAVGTNGFALDVLSIGYTPATYEPGTLMLLGSGLIGVMGVVRRKLGR